MLKYGGTFFKNNLSMGGANSFGQIDGRDCSTWERLMIRLFQKGRKSFTNAFSSNLNALNPNVFFNYGEITLEDKALTSP